MIHGDHETVVGDKELTKKLMNTVLKLDKLLLKEENLMKKNEIFQCMETLKSLLSENNDPSCDSSNVNGNNDNFDREKTVKMKRRGKERTTSVAVDVESYFKVEMDQ